MLVVATTGEKLKRARRRALLNQTQLADKAGVGLATIVRIEKNQVENPHVGTLRKLAAALEVEPAELLED
jgi:transcriptional regulator with XRE-family HTH domain